MKSSKSSSKTSEVQTTSARGFIEKPLGHLLKQILLIEGHMGLAYERSVGFEKDFHTHDRSILICPRGGTCMEVEVPSLKTKYVIDQTQVLLVPAGVEHNDKSLSAVYDTMALLPSMELVQQTVQENGLNDADGSKLETQCFKIKRTTWLDDILNRYFFERVINEKSPLGCTYFLEKQIMNELIRIVFSEKFANYGSDVDSEIDSKAQAALEFIETHIFEAITLEDIARHVRMSTASLLRIFKKEFKTTPYAYMKERRLDEALGLLKSRKYNVSDVSILVGYDDFGAFSKAFKAKFKVSPSQI